MIWKRALQNTTATRFARVNYLHSERHKPHPGQALASRDVVAIKNKTKKTQHKTRPRNIITEFDSIPQGHHLALLPFHRCPALLMLTLPGSCICLYKSWLLPTTDGQDLLFLVVTVCGHARTHILFFCGNSGKFNNILCNGRNVNCSLLPFLQMT